MSKFVENWQWDGNDLWHIGEGYEGVNPHRYVGINKNPKLFGSKLLKRDSELILLVPRMVDLLKSLHENYTDDDRNGVLLRDLVREILDIEG